MHLFLRCLNALVLTIALNLVSLSSALALNDPAQSPTPSTADPSPMIDATSGSPDHSDSLFLFYMATGAWIAILTAATLAIVIMAHRIAVAQRIRPLSDGSQRSRNSL